ncbi:hypothetical protein CON64_09935 [Bacillus pseudomycoides]|nr:hypothetical protein CON64_09935 [Bacillus pseudomycoides]
MKRRNIKKILKISPVAFALGISFLATPTQSFADDSSSQEGLSGYFYNGSWVPIKLEPQTGDASSLPKEANPQVPVSSLQEGLSGYYYYSEYNSYRSSWMPIKENYQTGDFSSLPTEASQGALRAAFWTGKIQVDETGEYSFIKSVNTGHTYLEIDGKTFYGEGEKIYLEKNKLYDIRIVSQNFEDSKDMNLKLYWITPKNQKEIIPAKHFFSPDTPKMPLELYENGAPGIRLS